MVMASCAAVEVGDKSVGALAGSSPSQRDAPPNEDDSMTDVKLVPAVRKAMEIITLLAESGGREFGVSEIAARLSFSKGTTHDILQTLVHYSVATQDLRTGKYRFGVRLVQLTDLHRIDMDDTSAFFEVAELIRRECKENINYSVLRGDFNYVLASLPAEDHVLKVDLPVGSTIPVIASSAGKVLVGDLEDKALLKMFDRHHPKFTPNTIVSREQFVAQVREARHAGYAVNKGEYEDGIFSVAAPVKNASGKVVAAVNIVAPASRYTEDFERMSISLTKWAGRELANRLIMRQRQATPST
jgi:DNA-binding IclR family transcriptional regulator